MSQARQFTRVPRWWWWTAVAGLPLTALLPVVGYWMRRGDHDVCAVDGQPIEPLFLVQIVENGGSTRKFCCLHCAELWLSRAPSPPAKILVTEEIGGELIDVADAFVVRSRVFSNAPTGDRRHVFRTLEQAQAHTDAFRGRLLTGEERPFATFIRSHAESPTLLEPAH